MDWLVAGVVLAREPVLKNAADYKDIEKEQPQ